VFTLINGRYYPLNINIFTSGSAEPGILRVTPQTEAMGDIYGDKKKNKA
jgi:hypothetical protein